MNEKVIELISEISKSVYITPNDDVELFEKNIDRCNQILELLGAPVTSYNESLIQRIAYHEEPIQNLKNLNPMPRSIEEADLIQWLADIKSQTPCYDICGGLGCITHIYNQVEIEKWLRGEVTFNKMLGELCINADDIEIRRLIYDALGLE